MQTITVRHTDGTTSSAPITPTVQVAFERHFKCGVQVLAEPDTLRLEYIYWMAWQATTAGRPNRPEFDVWLDTVEEIEQNEEQEDGPSPLGGTPPTGGSLPSPSSPALG